MALVVWLAGQGAAMAAQPSVFRGVVVADSPLGVRVISVEEASQAQLADLRPDDILVRVRDADIRSIDEFAVVSGALRGRAVAVPVLVFRNGTPRELTLHLYSYPVLQTWGLEVVPDHDLRFAEPRVGLDYWSRLGRGFEGAGKPAEALEAYLNGLHNVPTDTATALHVSRLFVSLSRQRLADGSLTDGIADLRQALQVLERLFDHPLTDEQLRDVRAQLRETLQGLRQTRVPAPSI
ncbi:MAG: PDZ domain-containing protein [Candidatus Omnitrophica bacterium]|nr:PDZ domain-containing protein [Candidatus Omnitrophota bacterium]